MKRSLSSQLRPKKIKCLGEKDHVMLLHDNDNPNVLASVMEGKLPTSHSFTSNTDIILSVKNENKVWRDNHFHGTDAPRISKNCLEFGVSRSHIPLGEPRPQWTSMVTFSLLSTRPSLFLGYTRPNVNPRLWSELWIYHTVPSLTSPYTRHPPPSLANVDLFPEFKMPLAHEISHKHCHSPRQKGPGVGRVSEKTLFRRGPASCSVEHPKNSINFICPTWSLLFQNLNLEAKNVGCPGSKKNH